MRLVIFLLALGMVSFLCSCSAAQTSQARRATELKWLREKLPPSKMFEQWLARTGELPPDFSRLEPVPFIQDPLVETVGGKERRVTAKEWPARRKKLAALTDKWLLGKAPPAPKNLRAVITSKEQRDGREVWKVRLEFGPDHAAKLNCTLYLPNGKTPAPVFLCNSERYLSWAADAMERGFACCIYNAMDRRDESAAYADLFGDYDWFAFRRRGWSASRAIDWLETLDFIDTTKIIIGGHSRGAKQAMAGAAFDERIAGVIASSPGSGGSIPYRYCDQTYFGESAELLTRVFPDWVHLKVRFFAGRENRLPADSHFIYALIAPRPVLMSTAINDWVESTWAVEQVYEEILPVYEMLGKPGNLALRYRPGQHTFRQGTTQEDYSRFMLAVAEGKPTPARLFPYRPYHPWDYQKWAKANPPKLDIARLPKRGIDDPTIDAGGKKLQADDWPARREDIREQIRWMLGDGPAYAPKLVRIGVGESDAEAALFERDWPKPPELVKCRFGDGINGNIYYPDTRTRGSGRKLPAVVWLGPFHCSIGYTGSYRAGEIAHVKLSRSGYITLAFDPIGTAGRHVERRDFYREHPNWSLMGKMVLDARNAVDVLEKLPEVDTEKIYLVGYAMGGMAASLAAALDDRVAGAAIIGGFTPFRTDTDDSGAGGVRRYSHLYGWMPRLGAFVGREAKVPVDFPEILAAAAPKGLCVVAPRKDWHATHADVVKAVGQARKAYKLLGAADALDFLEPDDWNRLTTEMQGQVIRWLNVRTGRANATVKELPRKLGPSGT